MNEYNYDPTVFDVATREEAKSIILTPEADNSTDKRWELETPALINLLKPYGPFKKILDYGCGIGRLSKELITNDNVIVGADISMNMRTLSIPYMASPNWIPVHPNYLQDLNIKFDLVLAVWVLQHVMHPAQTIKQIASLIRPGGYMLVVNNYNRVVPCQHDGKLVWATDGIDIRALLDGCSELTAATHKVYTEFKLPETFGKLSEFTWIRLYQKI
jgi:2-polyprenyl-3-methyl-5-hydroxy-6-metoxy-1,4-benzoquinol methylase